MVQIKGFVSNIYVYTILFVGMIGSTFLSVFYYFVSDSFSVFNILIFFSFIIFIFLRRLGAPFAFKRFSLNSEGIKFDKMFLKYAEIKTISIERGCVEEYNSRFFENLTFINQHDDIFVEEMICINCLYSGFKPKRKNNLIYIPRNRKTDAFMRKYCKAYENAVEESNQNHTYYPPKSRYRIFIFFLPLCFFSFVLCMIVASLFTNGELNVFELVCVLILGFASIITFCFRYYITSFISNKSVKTTNLKNRTK